MMITKRNRAFPPPPLLLLGAVPGLGEAAFAPSTGLVFLESGFEVPPVGAPALSVVLPAALLSLVVPVAPALPVPAFGTLDFGADPVSAFLLVEFALPLLSTEMVSDDSFLSAEFAEALVFGVSGVFTIRPLQFAVIP
ncbi:MULTISPECIES: hypothetical protein [Thalassospira]|uniref:hypothetical protein n=1 Tax=Thalassospira TaxID=168934 RepID=UPI001E37425A|nr:MULTISPECIES: hypothetical protein [Thalassospira]